MEITAERYTTPEEVDFAQQVLRDFVADIGNNWSGYGCKVWAGLQIGKLEELREEV